MKEEKEKFRFRVQDSWFRIQDSRFRIQDSGFKIQDSRFMVNCYANMVPARVSVKLNEKTYIPTPLVVNLQNIRLMGWCR